jgi:hypothetical protein
MRGFLQEPSARICIAVTFPALSKENGFNLVLLNCAAPLPSLGTALPWGEIKSAISGNHPTLLASAGKTDPENRLRVPLDASSNRFLKREIFTPPVTKLSRRNRYR